MKRTLILDVTGVDRGPAASALKEQLGSFGITAVDAPTLTQAIVSQWDEWLPREVVDRRTKKTILVFPGNGANIVRRYLPPRWLNGCFPTAVSAKRMWEPGSEPRAVVGKIDPEKPRAVTAVVIIDNVISSGETLREIMHVNDPVVPNARWYAVCWLMQASAFVKRYDGVFAPLVVGTAGGRVPINSLSSLLADAVMAEDYAHRNFGEQANALIGLLAELRERLPSERERGS